MMLKSILALVLFAAVSPVLRSEPASAAIPTHSASAIAGEWIYLGRDYDDDGNLVYLWEWSEYSVFETTRTKTPPPPPIDPRGTGQS